MQVRAGRGIEVRLAGMVVRDVGEVRGVLDPMGCRAGGDARQQEQDEAGEQPTISGGANRHDNAL